MSSASLLAQLLTGLSGASSLFLVAAGLTLIFGVTRVVNFAHGSLYMLGAYIAWTLSEALGRGPLGVWGGVLVAALAVAALGALIEALLLKRIYSAPELLQLAATFGIVLIVRDAALAIWGPEDLLGPRAPGFTGAIDVLGRAVPTYDLLLIAVGPVVLIGLTWLIHKTRFGMLVRAATENRVIAGALGINERALFTSVFALGAFLAGLAGALQLPQEPANLGMDLAIIAEAFVVTVVGGLGSIPGAFLAALVIGLTRALCIGLGTVEIGGIAIAFPKLTLVAEFVVMAVVLVVRPYGFLGKAPPAPPTTPLAEFRALIVAPGRPAAIAALVAFALAALLPFVGDAYTLVLATDVIVFALFAASLQFLMGTGGMASFGHAAYFGVGAYAAAIAAKHGWPMATALAAAPFAGFAGAVVVGWFCVRLSGVYLAMLTLAFAQIAWSIAFQWDSVTGGSNGLVGIWPPEWLAQGRALLLARPRPRRRRPRRARLDRTGAARVRAPRLLATRRCGRRRSVSTFAARSARHSRLRARSPDSPAGCMRSPRAASPRRRSPFRVPSTRSSWCCSAGSMRSPARSSAQACSPGFPTRSHGSPTTGTRCWVPRSS